MARDIKFVWEDYLENYIKIDNNQKEKNEFSDIFEDEEDSISPKMLTLYPSLGEIVKTPWGPAQINDKFAYHNFYELKFVHFKGFSSDTFVKTKKSESSVGPFGRILDSVDGVAMWKYIDPYCFLIGKARLYNWDEVVKNFDNKVRQELESLDGPKESLSTPIVQNNLINDNTTKKGYVAVKFKNGKVFETWEGQPFYDVDKKEILSMKNTIGDAEIIVGENNSEN